MSRYISDISKWESWKYAQEGPKAAREFSMRERDLSWAAETEWGVTKQREARTISVRDLLRRKGNVMVGMLGAQSINNHLPGGTRAFPMGPGESLPRRF